MRRLLLLLVLLSHAPLSASAGSWLFQPSYYSAGAPLAAAPSTAAPPTRRWVGGPYFTARQGEAIQGSWHVQRTFLNIPGRAYDQTYRWEAWIQGNAQY